jgi:hypothetical protein
MTATEHVAITPRAGALPTGQPAGYRYEWARFADWCTAADHTPLPAHPVTVAEFLNDHPAPPATQRRRLAAITWTHDAAGQPSPARAAAIRALLHPAAQLTPHEATARDAAERARLTVTTEALLRLPATGWPHGLFGRRDALLLALTHHAHLSYEQVSRLHRDQVHSGPDHQLLLDIGPYDQRTVTAAEDPRLCPTCIHHRWNAVLAYTDRHPAHRSLRTALHHATPVTATTPHWDQISRDSGPVVAADVPVLVSGAVSTVATGGADQPVPDKRPLFAPIDGWGYLPWQPTALTAKAVARIVTEHLTGQAPGHRALPVTMQAPVTAVPAAPPALPLPAASDPTQRAEAVADALQKRHREHRDLTVASAALAAAEHRIEDLLHRTLALLESAEPPPRPTKKR